MLDKTENSEPGKFGWVMEPEGNKIELWQPPEGEQWISGEVAGPRAGLNHVFSHLAATVGLAHQVTAQLDRLERWPSTRSPALDLHTLG